MARSAAVSAYFVRRERPSRVARSSAAPRLFPISIARTSPRGGAVRGNRPERRPSHGRRRRLPRRDGGARVPHQARRVGGRRGCGARGREVQDARGTSSGRCGRSVERSVERSRREPPGAAFSGRSDTFSGRSDSPGRVDGSVVTPPPRRRVRGDAARGLGSSGSSAAARSGSLLGFLDATFTPPGRRRLREWILQPPRTPRRRTRATTPWTRSARRLRRRVASRRLWRRFPGTRRKHSRARRLWRASSPTSRTPPSRAAPPSSPPAARRVPTETPREKRTGARRFRRGGDGERADAATARATPRGAPRRTRRRRRLHFGRRGRGTRAAWWTRSTRSSRPRRRSRRSPRTPRWIGGGGSGETPSPTLERSARGSSRAAKTPREATTTTRTERIFSGAGRTRGRPRRKRRDGPLAATGTTPPRTTTTPRSRTSRSSPARFLARDVA